MSDLDKELHDLLSRHAAQQRQKGAKGKECLGELTLHHYLEKKSDPRERERVEKHLLLCYDCLQTIAEVSKAKTMFEKGKLKSWSLPKEKKLSPRRKRRGWLVATFIAFACSFFFHRYFIQFSVATLLLGIKWIVETRTTKTLIAIQEAYKRGDRQTAADLLEKLGKR